LSRTEYTAYESSNGFLHERFRQDGYHGYCM
jgi:hypothetical protein